MAESNETMTLEIEFAGMCLFVHDDGCMYVLLPTVAHQQGGTGCGEHQEHLARLFYTKKNRTGGTAPEETTESGETYVMLNGADLRFSGSGGADASPTIADEVVNLTTSAPKERVRRELLSAPVRGPLAARVVLESGTLGKPFPWATWDYDGDPLRKMAVSGTWVIENVPAPLELNVNGEPLRLSPSGGLLKIHIFNATAPETPLSTLDADACDDASHFVEYGKLLRNAVMRAPRRNRTGGSKGMFGRLFTCIMAQADVEQGSVATAHTTQIDHAH